MRASLKVCTLVCLPALLSGTNMAAAVIAIGSSAFPVGSTLIAFTGLADGTEVNGLTVSGVFFKYTMGGYPLNGAVVIDGGPGTTNNISLPNILSIGDNMGALTLTLPSPATAIGFGYALLNTTPLPAATTISLFQGATFLGSLSYPGVPDPIFTGGFAGIQSTNHFDQVVVTFNGIDAPAFALDNIRIAAAIPEPATTLLMLSGGLVLWCRLGRRRR